MRDKLERYLADVSKKFRSILELSIREAINKMVVDPRKQISWPLPESEQIVAALIRSKEYIRDILMHDEETSHFIGVAWCSLYLEKLRSQFKSVLKQVMNSNGTRKSKDIDWSDNIYWKFKELEYIVTNLIELRDYLPGFNAVIMELEEERKRLEHPN